MAHPWHDLGRKPEKTPQDRALIAAILVLSTKNGFTHMTFERIYDWLVAFELEAESKQPLEPSNV